MKLALGEELDRDEALQSFISKEDSELQEALDELVNQFNEYDFAKNVLENPVQSNEDEEPISDEEYAERVLVNMFKSNYEQINRRSEN